MPGGEGLSGQDFRGFFAGDLPGDLPGDFPGSRAVQMFAAQRLSGVILQGRLPDASDEGEPVLVLPGIQGVFFYRE